MLFISNKVLRLGE